MTKTINELIAELARVQELHRANELQQRQQREQLEAYMESTLEQMKETTRVLQALADELDQWRSEHGEDD